MAADIGARAADQALDDGHEQSRQRDRQEQKAEPGGQHCKHALRQARQRRRRHGREAQQNESEREEEPARQPEIGDLLECVDEPARQRAAPNRSPRRRGETSKQRSRSQRARSRPTQQPAAGEFWRAGREARTRLHAPRLRNMFSGSAAFRIRSARAAGPRLRRIHGAPADSKTAMVIGWPLLML